MNKNQNISKLELFVGDLRYAGWADGFQKTARFAFPEGITIDKDGNIYVADSTEGVNVDPVINNLIRKITPEGEVSTIAGVPGQKGALDGPARQATFYRPTGIAIDTSKNLFVADQDNHCIRKISTSGHVSVFAGLCGARGSKNGKATEARFFTPIGLVFDNQGNLFVADSTNRVIRKITPEGVVSTLAGSSETYGESQDGIGSQAIFNQVNRIAIDKTGVLYVTDSSRIRKITPNGEVTTLNLKIKTGVDLGLTYSKGIAIDLNGFIYTISNNAIYKISPDGEVNFFAGSTKSQNDDDDMDQKDKLGIQLNDPSDLACDSLGNIYVADTKNFAIRKISTEGIVSSFAGPTQEGSLIPTKNESQIVVDSKGNLYVNGWYYISNFIHKINPKGEVNLISTQFVSGIESLAIDKNDNVYLGEYHPGESTSIGGSGYSLLPRFIENLLKEKSFFQLHKISATKKISAVLDKSRKKFLSYAVDSQNAIYIITWTALKKITPRTLLPNKEEILIDYEENNLAISNTKTDTETPHLKTSPLLISINKKDQLYILEESSLLISQTTPSLKPQRESKSLPRYYVIKKLNSNGKWEIVAGSTQVSGLIDGKGALASFDQPISMSFDEKNNLYILEKEMQVIRKLDESGSVTTIIGRPDEKKFLEGPLPAGLAKAKSITVHGNSLYILMTNGIGVVRELP